jgi:hypothetical protein
MRRQRYLWLLGSDAAPDVVIGTAMKGRIHVLCTPHTALSEALEAAKTTSDLNGDISGRRSRTKPPTVSLTPPCKGAAIDTLHLTLTPLRPPKLHQSSNFNIFPCVNETRL